MNSPTLSVIMPCFNGAEYLRQSLDAILKQSFRPMEIIVVDDASTDSSPQIVEELRLENPSIRLLRNDRNQGPNGSIHRGLEAAGGDYFHGAGADDLVIPGFYSKAMALLAQYPTAPLCSGLTYLIDGQGLEIRAIRPKAISRNAGYWTPHEALEHLLTNDTWIWGNTVVYRREAYRGLGGIQSEFGSYGNHVLDQALALKYGACYIPEFLGYWRRLQTSYSSRTVAQPQLMLTLIDRIAAWMKSEPDHLFPSRYIGLWRRRQLLELTREHILADPGMGGTTLDFLNSHLSPRSPADALAIAVMRRVPALRRLLIKILKSRHLAPASSTF